MEIRCCRSNNITCILSFALLLLANHDKLSSENTAQQMCNNVRLVDYIKISGVEHDILHSADKHLNQFWAVLDAFIPGTRINKKSINY